VTQREQNLKIIGRDRGTITKKPHAILEFCEQASG